jgi:nucleotide-binding universal stress UspA family protein
MSRTILVATDGTPAALGALRFAEALAGEKKARVHVLAVVEPVPVFDAGFMVALPEMELYESRREALRQEVRSQLAQVLGDSDAWPLAVVAGLPGPKIVKHAEDIGADVILMGLGRHGPMDRVFGTETALQVLRISHLPILAVPEHFSELPRSAVLGLDFSLFSHRAAQAAVSLLGSPAEVYLVHVLSGMEFLPTLSEEWRGEYEGEVMERLEEFGQGLEASPGFEIRPQILEGEPGHELLGFADAKDVELLAAGSHGHSFVGRLLMGSVSTRLVRGARCSVLVVPPQERAEEIRGDGDASEPLQTWAQELDRFTRLHAGRHATLHLTDPELGTRECGRDLPLWGVDYDAKKDRVNIMFGRCGTVEGHLTHSLPAPSDIEIRRDEEGRPEALWIRFRRGEVLLRVHRE